MWIGAREIGIEMIQKIDSEREIDIEMIGARELWIGAVDQYRPRGRVDSDLGIEMGYGCRELYQRERERELHQKK